MRKFLHSKYLFIVLTVIALFSSIYFYFIPAYHYYENIQTVKYTTSGECRYCHEQSVIKIESKEKTNFYCEEHMGMALRSAAGFNHCPFSCIKYILIGFAHLLLIPVLWLLYWWVKKEDKKKAIPA